VPVGGVDMPRRGRRVGIGCWCGLAENTEGEGHDAENDEETREMAGEDTVDTATTTCSYGFQMRGFLRRTTTLSTALVSRDGRLRSSEAGSSIMAVNEFHGTFLKYGSGVSRRVVAGVRSR